MKSFYIKTFGCQMNVSDSQRITGFLEKMAFKPVKKIEEADLVVFNTCGVRQTAENSAMGLVHNLKEQHPKTLIVLTGCLAKRKDVQKKLKNKVDLFLSIGDFSLLKKWLAENYQKKSPRQTGRQLSRSSATQKSKSRIDYFSIKPSQTGYRQAFVPIMTGCNNFCSYCVVPYARGREVSRPVDQIQKEIAELAKNGCQEITLLGQNVNSYFQKNNTSTNFPALLDLLAKSQPQIIFKFLTSHPKDFSQKLMRVIAENKNVSKEIHLPVQSGSNKILRLMNRPYTQQHYLALIDKARQIIPKVRFTTDVIVGFPGETEKDFLQTAKVLEKVGYNLVFINKYSPRPGTAAFKLEDSVSWNEKKRREKELRQRLEKIN